MFAGLFLSLTQKLLSPRVILVLLVLLSLGGAVGYGYVKIHSLKAQVVKVEQKNTELKTQVDGLTLVVDQKTKALQECSDATQKAVQMANETAKRAAAAQAVAKKDADAKYQKAKDILKDQAKPGQSSCDAANDLLNGLISSAPTGK